MSSPVISFLVNGHAQSIEAVRARGLACRLPQDRVRFLYRDFGRYGSLRRWHRQLKQERPQCAYVLNTALPGAALAPWLRQRHGIPYVLDTGDAVFSMARRSGIQAGWRLPLIWLLERSAQHYASAIVVRGTRHREYLLSQGFTRVAVIRDGYADQIGATSESVAALRQKLGLNGRFVVGVMGSLVFSPRLGICYGWDLIQALSKLRHLPITGLIIGDGNGRAWLEALARRLDVFDRIIFCGRIPYEQVPTHLRLMDIALSTQTNNLPGQVRTTGKLPEYMAAGRFILASRVGDATLLLPELMLMDYVGEVDPDYPPRLAERIQMLHAQPHLLDLRHTLPDMARRECSYEILSEMLAKLVGGLGSGTG